MLEKEIKYVTDFLISTNGNDSRRSQESFRKRSEHSKRVLQYAIDIVNNLKPEEKKGLDENIIYTAVIFHDVGYGVESFYNSHPIEGSMIYMNYAKDNNVDLEFAKKVSELILHHSDKENILKYDVNEQVLMEADMMDEEGAMSICWDLMTLGQTMPKNYEEALEKIKNYSLRILNKNLMVHEYPKKIWKEKQEFVKKFYNELEKELFKK